MYKAQNDCLMSKWQEKENHQGKDFIKDGIVNFEQWKQQLEGKKILFVLKEAYGDPFDLCKWLSEEDNLGHAMWNRVAEWAKGLLETTSTSIYRYAPLEKRGAKEQLNKIAIMNIKKSDGKKKSEDEDLTRYAETDAAELKAQFELINPDIVVCGYTFNYLNMALGMPIDKKVTPCDNYYYWHDNKLFIDYYHPAGRTDRLMMYYGLCAIYQQALLEKEKREHHADQ